MACAKLRAGGSNLRTANAHLCNACIYDTEIVLFIHSMCIYVSYRTNHVQTAPARHQSGFPGSLGFGFLPMKGSMPKSLFEVRSAGTGPKPIGAPQRSPEAVQKCTCCLPTYTRDLGALSTSSPSAVRQFLFTPLPKTPGLHNAKV